MPTNAPISFTFAGLASGYCFTGFDRFALDIVAAMSGYVPGTYNFFNYGNTTPDVDDQNKPWIRLNADGSFDKVYVYVGGLWLSPHAMPPGMRLIAPASCTAASDVWALDGGDGSDPSTTPPTLTSGAMWEVDSALSAKFPLGAGTLPSSAVVAVGDSGGEEKHSLTVAQLAPHSHTLANEDLEDDAIGGAGESTLSPSNHLASGAGKGNGSNAYTLVGTATEPTIGLTGDTGGTGSPAVVEAHNTMPPYCGVLFIRRTARLYYRP